MEAWGAILGLPVVALVLVVLVAKGRVAPGRAVSLFTLAAWFLLMLGITILPALVRGDVAPLVDPWNTLKLTPFRTILGQLDTPGRLVVQSGGNMAMFVPLGLLLPLAWSRFQRLGPTLWIAAGLSLGVELGQLALLLAHVGLPRVVDASDVILNVTGAAVGWVAMAWVVQSPAGTSGHGRGVLAWLRGQPSPSPREVG